MKKLLLALLCAAVAPALPAQTLNAGFRVGPTAFLSTGGGQAGMPFAYQQGAITPELFGRYQGKGHWAFELTAATPTSLYSENRIMAVGASWEHGVEQVKSHYYELGLAAQYELSCRHTKTPGKVPRLHYYLGLSAAAVLINDRSEVYADGYPETSVMSTVSNDFQMWGGLNHTLTYSLTKPWTLMATSDFRMNLNYLTGIGENYGASYPEASVGLRVGAGYCIWKKK